MRKKISLLLLSGILSVAAFGQESPEPSEDPSVSSLRIEEEDFIFERLKRQLQDNEDEFQFSFESALSEHNTAKQNHEVVAQQQLADWQVQIEALNIVLMELAEESQMLREASRELSEEEEDLLGQNKELQQEYELRLLLVYEKIQSYMAEEEVESGLAELENDEVMDLQELAEMVASDLAQRRKENQKDFAQKSVKAHTP
ncbi:MAG: hypothetical protein AAF399_16280, partial [Bacteroidota bacterium]